MAFRIIAISDSHDFCPDFVMKHIMNFKPDVLLHCGDIEKQETHDIFASLAPSFSAIRGDHDKLSLEERNVIVVDGMRIGQTHGDRPTYRERPSTFVNKLLRGRSFFWNGFAHDALAQFSEELDILVTGHLHIPFKRMIGRTLVINPGAIVVNGRQHHLKVPTLTVLEKRGDTYIPMFFALLKGWAPVPLMVGRNGPVKGQFQEVGQRTRPMGGRNARQFS
jgi:putative phosphoesterase